MTIDNPWSLCSLEVGLSLYLSVYRHIDYPESLKLQNFTKYFINKNYKANIFS